MSNHFGSSRSLPHKERIGSAQADSGFNFYNKQTEIDWHLERKADISNLKNGIQKLADHHHYGQYLEARQDIDGLIEKLKELQDSLTLKLVEDYPIGTKVKSDILPRLKAGASKKTR